MKKILLLAIIVVASINAKAEFFGGAGVSKKTYTITVENTNGDFDNLHPFVTLGYYWSKFRFHFDTYLETEFKSSKDSNYKSKFTEHNLFADYNMALTKSFNLYAGIGLGALTVKDKLTTFFDNNFGLLGEVGMIYTAKSVDYGLAIKSTFIGYKNKVSNLEYKVTSISLPEIFIAKRF